MDNDLLKNTLKQVIDLIHHNFLSQAEEIAEQALKVFDDRNLWQLLAICKIGMKKYKEAESILRKSLENHPNPSDFNNLSIVLKSIGKIEEALEYAKLSIGLSNKNHRYLANISNIYYLLNQFDLAVSYMNEACTLCPSCADYIMNLAAYKSQNGDKQEAFEEIKKALTVDPKPEYYVEGFYCLAAQKKYEKAWQFYEHRYASMPQVSKFSQQYNLPVLFEKKNFYEEKIAIVFEQGLGDNVMYSRFIAQFLEKAPNAYVLMTDQIVESFFRALAVPIRESIEEGTTHLLGIMSLPYHLETKEIPPSVKLWQHTPKKSSKLKVGIVWAGSAFHPCDDVRSTYFLDFMPFLNDPEIEVCSLMRDRRKRKRVGQDEVVDYALGFEDYKITDYGSKMDDVLSTIEVLNEIDILVSVDTAIVHIAGTIGVPTYVLVNQNCDWRWGVDEKISDWYSSIEIFRTSKTDNYKDVLCMVHKKIRGEKFASY